MRVSVTGRITAAVGRVTAVQPSRSSPGPFPNRHVESRTDEGFEKLRSWEVKDFPRCLTLGSPRRDSRQRLIRSRNRILIVLLGPLCGPNDRLYISVLVCAEDHALVDLGLRGQVNAA